VFALSVEGPRRGVATLVDPGRAVAPLALLYDLETGQPFENLRVRWGSRILENRLDGFSAESGLGCLDVAELPTTLPVLRPSCRVRVDEVVHLVTPHREAFGHVSVVDPIPRMEPYERRFLIRTDIGGWPEAVGAPVLDDRGRLLGVCLSIGPVVVSPSEWLGVGGPRHRLSLAIRTQTWRAACDIVEDLLEHDEESHDPELLAAAGRILEQLHERAGACAYYVAAAQDDPGNAWTRYRAGCCFTDLGQRHEGRRWLEQAIRLEPWNMEFRRALRLAGGGPG